jgi:non-specific serine/threonine protein kinase
MNTTSVAPASFALAAVVSPHGALRLERTEAAVALDGAVAARLEAAFARGAGHGLLQLGLAEAGSRLPADLAWWRALAIGFVAARCRAGETGAQQPGDGEFARLADDAPPMRGGEYLDASALAALWRALAGAFEDELAGSGASLDAFLAAHDSRWRHVGRVHFHLAENRRDAERPFAFLATYAPGLAAHGEVRHAPLGAALRQYAGAGAKTELLRLLEPVSRASESCAWLKAIVDSGEIFHPLRWTPSEAMRLLEDVAALEQAGLVVRMPAGWPGARPSRPKVEATIGARAPSLVGAGQVLDFALEVTLDGETLSRAEIESLVASTDGLAMLRGRWVEVDREKLKAALDRYAEIERLALEEGISFGKAMRLLAGVEAGGREATPAADWGEVKAGEWLAETLAACRRPEALAAASPGAALRATLRPYQDAGVRWLGFLTRLGLGACLADDMGLGKTLQVLALALTIKGREKPARPSLVVAPASLLANWASEAERFAPTLGVFVAHPAFTPPERLKAPEDTLAACDLVVTSYAALLRLPWIGRTSWRLVVVDEAQAIKNPGAKQTRAVKALKTDARIALTGTPVENNLNDLWSIFDFLNPGLLGSATAFRIFAKGLADRTPPSYAPLRKLVAPYILRRMKTDRSVIADLPDKAEVKAWCGLTRKQAALYQTTVEAFQRRLEESGDGMGRRGLVLATLMRLKQICNHAAHGLGGGGAWPSEDSGKFARLAEIASTIASRQEKLLVFTQFAEIIEPLGAELAGAFGRPGLMLSGDTAVGRRRELVKTFQEDERVPFFVLSLKAGGSGLTLTEASHVVHFDRWWNPAVENQATDRAFRIGQRRNVLVHKFVCRGTIEERIDSLIESKRAMAEELLSGGGEINLTELGDRELLDLVRLDLDAATREAP